MSKIPNKQFRESLFFKESVKSHHGTYTINVTPTLAESWLEWNDGNRRVTNRHVINIAKQMVSGNWMLNGQCLIMGSNGKLLDGQHRLHAVIECGKTILMDVRFGIDPETFKTIDEGKKRSPGDVLSIVGTKDANNVAAAARFVMSYDYGNSKTVQKGSYGGLAPSNSDVLKWVKENPSIEEDVMTGASLYTASSRLVLSRSMFAAFIYIAKRVDEADAESFFGRLATGHNLSVGTISRLRDRLIRSKLDKSNSLPTGVRNQLVAKYWNAWRDGKEVKQIKLPKTTNQIKFK